MDIELTNDLPPKGNVAPEWVEQLFAELFLTTYKDGNFDSVQALLRACGAVVRKELGAFLFESNPPPGSRAQ